MVSTEKITLLVIVVSLAVVGFLLFQLLGTDDEVEIEPISSQDRSAEEPAEPYTRIDGERGGVEPEDEQGREKLDPTLIRPAGAEAAGAVAGRVVNKAGQPVNDAEVTLAAGSMVFLGIVPEEKELDIRDKTDGQGLFRLGGLVPGREYTVVVKHASYADTNRSPVVVPAGGEVELADIVMNDGYTVRGTVMAKGGSALDGIKVELLDPTAGGFGGLEDVAALKESLTSGGGAYTFENVATSTFEVRASGQGFGAQSKRAVQYGSDRIKVIDFELEPGEGISGVVKSADGEPVLGATVRATRVLAKDYTSTGSAITAGNGSFAVSGLAKGSYVLRATCEGYTAGIKQRVASGASEVVIELQRQGGATGTVKDQNTGQPVPEFTLTVYRHREGKPRFQIGAPRHIKSAGGSYKIADLDPESYVIDASAPGYATCTSASFRVVRGQIQEGIDIFMNRGGALAGRVVGPDGAGVRGAQITLRYNRDPSADLFGFLGAGTSEGFGDSGTEAVTDGSGGFLKRLITPGTYQVHVEHPAYCAAEINDVTVFQDENPVDIGVVALKVGATVKGRSLDPAGSPLPGVVVLLSRETGYQARQVVSDKDARFEFNHLEAGDYSVTIQAAPATPEQEMNVFSQLISAEKSKVKIYVGEGEVKEVAVRLVQ